VSWKKQSEKRNEYLKNKNDNVELFDTTTKAEHARSSWGRRGSSECYVSVESLVI
jgi:ABC-type sulfate transport system substrate-binding protein